MVIAARDAAKERVAEQILSVVRLPYYPVMMLLGISPTDGIPQHPYSRVGESIPTIK